jgi:hypothetical protein
MGWASRLAASLSVRSAGRNAVFRQRHHCAERGEIQELRLLRCQAWRAHRQLRGRRPPPSLKRGKPLGLAYVPLPLAGVRLADAETDVPSAARATTCGPRLMVEGFGERAGGRRGPKHPDEETGHEHWACADVCEPNATRPTPTALSVRKIWLADSLAGCLGRLGGFLHRGRRRGPAEREQRVPCPPLAESGQKCDHEEEVEAPVLVRRQFEEIEER